MNLNRRVAGLGTCLAAALAVAVAPAAIAADGAASMAPDLSLEDLLKADVQTASRKTQRLQEVAAAVFVITREDIERSGALSIPEALRLAPGVEVARISNDRWAVSARGFNGRFANKLLVLMDGRSVYSPNFAGVRWEVEDTLLDDIDRIEVIRGPGAALWGANAVNGVINIITRKARDTLGTMAVAGAGSDDRAFGSLRQGFAVGDGHARVWAKAFARDPSVDVSGEKGNDYWRAWRMGFRGDWNLDASRRVTLSGAVNGGPSGERWDTPSLTSASGIVPTNVKQTSAGGHLLVRHEWLGSDGSEAALQGYAVRSVLNVVGMLQEASTLIDLDFQHRLRLGGAHDVVWGLGYRASRDTVDSSSFIFLTPTSRSRSLIDMFVQDEITLKPDTLKAVVGARVEDNSLTRVEWQPNARLIWTPTPQQSFWGAASRAVRMPSRGEQDTQIDLAVVPTDGTQPPVLLRNVPSAERRIHPEVVSAFELGMRQQFDTQVSLDIALFHNSYTQLRAGTTGAATVESDPVPHVMQAVELNNSVEGEANGVEVALDWRASRTWRIQSTYSYLRIRTHATSADPIEVGSALEYNSSAPQHQVSLRSSSSLSPNTQLDLWLRYTGALPATGPGLAEVPAYTALDVRLAWFARPGLELSLVGQNLLDRRHPEFIPDLLPAQTMQVQRSVYAKAKWRF